MRRCCCWALTGIALLTGCDVSPDSGPGDLENVEQAPQRVAQGTEFMLAAPTPQAMEAGRQILEDGGNAVDAAAAAAFALWVTDPLMSSVGGRAQILVRLADGRVVGIDGATQAPGEVGKPADTGHGYRTAPVPGSPAALEEMLLAYGTLTLAEVLEPAMRIAREGFPVPRDVHDALVRYEDRLTLYPGTRAHFYKADGSAYEEGEILRQPALAETMGILAREGMGALYRGSLAEAIVGDMAEHGGLVGLADLAQYRTLPGEVVHGRYRGREIVARGGNCDGASVVQMLQMLEHVDLSAYSIQDPEYISVLAQTLLLGKLDEYVPDSIQVSPAHARRRFREIDVGGAFPLGYEPGEDIGPDGDTNHLSVVDGDGNAVAITQSIGPSFGSKVASPELGFFYAYSYDMNDDPIPFQREKTSQSPTMLLEAGTPFLVLGSAGSSRIPGSIVRTVVNVVDHGMSLAEAVWAPRWFIVDDGLRIEADDLPETTLESLRARGYRLEPYEGLDGYFARIHAVLVDPDTGLLWGGSDPRDLGAAGGM